eukprot:gene10118-8019_t
MVFNKISLSLEDPHLMQLSPDWFQEYRNLVFAACYIVLSAEDLPKAVSCDNKLTSRKWRPSESSSYLMHTLAPLLCYPVQALMHIPRSLVHAPKPTPSDMTHALTQSIVKMFAKKAAKDAAAATELLADSPPTSSRRVAKKNETIEITDDNDTDVVQKSNKVESPSLTTSMVNPPTVGVSMWLGQKKHYDVYDKESPIEGRLEQDGPRNTRRNTRQRNKPVSRYSADEPAAQATNAPDTLSSDDESDKEPAEFQHFLAQVEKNAVTLIDHLERFVTRDVGLGRLEQGMLMHIVLNADNHSTDGPGGVLSPKAFR